MADTQNLSQFLTDVADAIRIKKETTDAIPAENFDSEILSIETGIDTTSENPITAEDVVNGKEGFVNGEKITGNIKVSTTIETNAYSISDNSYEKRIRFNAIANVDNPTLIRTNTNIFTGTGYNALANVIGLTSEKIMEGNTILGVEGTGSGTTINNQDKNIVTNGTYTADEGYTGLGTVTVNVPSVSGIPVYSNISDLPVTATNGDLAVVYSKSVQNVTSNQLFMELVCPENITPPYQVEGNYQYTLYDTNGNAAYTLIIDMGSVTIADVSGNSQSDFIFRYDSGMGDIYTRSVDTPETIVLPKPLYIIDNDTEPLSLAFLFTNIENYGGTYQANVSDSFSMTDVGTFTDTLSANLYTKDSTFYVDYDGYRYFTSYTYIEESVELDYNVNLYRIPEPFTEFATPELVSTLTTGHGYPVGLAINSGTCYILTNKYVNNMETGESITYYYLLEFNINNVETVNITEISIPLVDYSYSIGDLYSFEYLKGELVVCGNANLYKTTFTIDVVDKTVTTIKGFTNAMQYPTETYFIFDAVMHDNTLYGRTTIYETNTYNAAMTNHIVTWQDGSYQSIFDITNYLTSITSTAYKVTDMKLYNNKLYLLLYTSNSFNTSAILEYNLSTNSAKLYEFTSVMTNYSYLISSSELWLSTNNTNNVKYQLNLPSTIWKELAAQGTITSTEYNIALETSEEIKGTSLLNTDGTGNLDIVGGVDDGPLVG